MAPAVLLQSFGGQCWALLTARRFGQSASFMVTSQQLGGEDDVARTGTQLGPLNHYLSCATGLTGLCDAVLDPAATVLL